MAQTQGTWHLVNPTSLILCKQLNELQTFINIKRAQLKQHVCQSPSHPLPHTLSKQDRLTAGEQQESDEADPSATLTLAMSNTVRCAGHNEGSVRATYPDRTTRTFLKILRNILLNVLKGIFSLGFARKCPKTSYRDGVNTRQHHRKLSRGKAGTSFPCILFPKDVLVPMRKAA